MKNHQGVCELSCEVVSWVRNRLKYAFFFGNFFFPFGRILGDLCARICPVLWEFVMERLKESKRQKRTGFRTQPFYDYFVARLTTNNLAMSLCGTLLPSWSAKIESSNPEWDTGFSLLRDIKTGTDPIIAPVQLWIYQLHKSSMDVNLLLSM